jgi:acyl carrier protein
MTKNEFFLVIAEALGVEPSSVTIATSQSDLEEWDSLGHLAILQALDNKTGGQLDAVKGVGSITTVGSLWEAMHQAGLVQE